MGRAFILPKEIFTGADALATAQGRLGQLGKKALIVTDEVMIKLGNVKKVQDVLDELGVGYSVYADISGEPNDTMIEKGVAVYQNEGCDFLIGLGGGSPIDSMKAIAALAVGGGAITDYMGKEITGDLPAMVAIPTTAGTGSEATQFTIITDTKNDVKMLLKGQALMSTIAIVDPQFTITAPPAITAATGLDALTHAVEAYVSIKAQPMSDTFALSAVKRIFDYLPAAYKDGSDVTAREEMSIAALEAGVAFNNASVTIVHGMSRPIGALFHVPHGLSNAMLLVACLRYVAKGATERFAELGRSIGVATDLDSPQAATEKFMAALEAICAELDTPSIAEHGIDVEEFAARIDKMASDAMVSGSPQNSRMPLTEDDLKTIYRALIA